MNYKVLPLFAILVLMVLPFSTANVYGAVSNVITVDNQSVDGLELGSLDPHNTPTGMTANTDGNFLAWTITDDTVFEDWLFFSKTTDGSNWSTPLNITGVQNEGFEYPIDQIAIFANATTNTIDILYSEETTGSTEAIMHVRSTNNGESFGSPTIIVGGVSPDDHLWYAVSGDDVFVVYANQNSGDLHFIGSYDGGSTFPTSSLIDDGDGGGTFPVGSYRNLVMQTGGEGTGSSANVWVVFTAQDTTNFDRDVYTSYSVDGGGAWTTVLTVSDESGTDNEGEQFQTHLFVDYVANDVLIIFQGEGGGATQYLSQAKSTNNGVSFSAQENIELGIVCQWGGFNLANAHFVSYDGTNIQVLCVGDGGVDIMQSVSTDFGDNYSSFQSLASDPLDNVSAPFLIKADGDHAYAVWTVQDTSGEGFDGFSDLVYSSSEDAGVNWSTHVELDGTDNQGTSRTQLTAFGETIVYIVAEFSSGVNEVRAWFESFTPPDSDIPVITLVGANPQLIVLDAEFNDLGATCQDPTQGNVDGNVSQENNVNTSIAGNYLQEYNCDDGVGNNAVSVPRTITVLDDTDNPTITLLGANPDTMQIDTSYQDAGAVCSDPTEGNIDGNVVVDSENIANSVRGSYTVFYDCQDSAGNDAPTVQRTVVVQKASTGISSGTTSGTSQGSGGQQNQEMLTLDDVPPITGMTPSGEIVSTPQLPTLQFGDGEGFSISDFFANLFGNRLDATTGETVSQGVQDSQLGQVVSSSSGQPSTTGQPSNAGLSIVNAIQNFFSNLFN